MSNWPISAGLFVLISIGAIICLVANNSNQVFFPQDWVIIALWIISAIILFVIFHIRIENNKIVVRA